MGIPKFFRSMSERYPLISQLIEENKIPEFDNLYLDMNGIIHNCSHPNDGDVNFRMTEAEMFLSIFSYIDHLFSKIKPKKMFFLAVDGVAPRAKMNQQRSRRFRTAKEAKELKEKAIRKGEELPKEEAFDSNCITPGTPFMALLSEQLKYFIAKKVTEDSAWRGVEVVLSGHETPGEGEHKIMEYIRLSRSQPGYNPNTRHCMYGLDADLIMLGLLTHDPHFALLREEVSFGPKKGKSKSLDSTNFFLLHLSLIREYLDHEFNTLKTKKLNGFEYNLENIIDDFILLNIFVGNDFLPHLPGLHINEGALPLLFQIYKKVLPNAGGYLNENGKLNTGRLELVLDELRNFEKDEFVKDNADLVWYQGKQESQAKALEVAKAKAKFNPTITLIQKEYLDLIHSFILTQRSFPSSSSVCFLPSKALESNARDRKFLKDLSNELHLRIEWDEYDPDNDCMTVAISINDHAGLNGALKKSDMLDKDLEDDAEDKIESDKAVDRVLKKYLKAEIIDDGKKPSTTNGASKNGLGEELEGLKEEETEYEKKVREKMTDWKRDYYKNKLEIDFNDSKAMNDLAFRYAEGLQWVLHYYYDGVASWGWFYDYHYSPKISDLKDVGSMKFDFDLGKPFRPFDQLMGVLPALSSKHIPEAFRSLMTDSESPISDFYPSNFDADLNGKKQDWEAVVKIPFIDAKRLLDALNKRESRLSKDEKSRNGFGEATKFTYDEENEHFLATPLKGHFPDLVHSRAKIEEYHLPTLGGGKDLSKGLIKGVFLGEKALAGFPSLMTLPHYSSISRHGVNVFQSDSRGESVVVHIENRYSKAKSEDIAKEMVGKRTFVNWPFLYEGKVTAISDGLFRYEMGWIGNQRKIVSEPLKANVASGWGRKADRIEHHFSKRYGVVIGSVEIILHVQPLKGLKRTDDGALVKDYDDRSDKEIEYPLQLAVNLVEQEDGRFEEQEPQDLRTEFPNGSPVFFLGEHLYGSPGSISFDSNQPQDQNKNQLAVRLFVFQQQAKELAALRQLVSTRVEERYVPSFQVAKICRISGFGVAKLTSSMMVEDGRMKVNIGLNLKFEAKGLKVLGYSRKNATGWEFSQRAIDLIMDYKVSLRRGQDPRMNVCVKENFPEVIQAFQDRPHEDFTKSTQFFGMNADSRMGDLKKWIKQKGVRDLEAVSLFAEQLDRPVVEAIENLLTRSAKVKSLAAADGSSDKVRKMMIKGLPRTAVLKPDHAVFRLQEQQFSLGDRVVAVGGTGTVPLSAHGVIVGIATSSVDVVFDVPFIGGTSLEGRCSPHRGATLPPVGLLNLSHPQYVSSATPSASPSVAPAQAQAPASPSQAIRAPLGPNGSGFPSSRNAAQSTSSSTFRPPNHFKAAQATSTSQPGLQILQRDGQQLNGKEKGPDPVKVSSNFQFSGVAGGREKPSQDRKKAMQDLNPHLAALSLGGGNSSNGTSTRGNPRVGEAQQAPQQPQQQSNYRQQWQQPQQQHQQPRAYPHPSAGNQLLQQLQGIRPPQAPKASQEGQAPAQVAPTPPAGPANAIAPTGPKINANSSRGRGAPRGSRGGRGDFSNGRGRGRGAGRGGKPNGAGPSPPPQAL